MASETLDLLANLSNSAIRLLAYRMIAGMDKTPVAEIMRISGIRSKTSYYAAKREIEAAGLVDVSKIGTGGVSKNDTSTKNWYTDVPKNDTSEYQKLVQVSKIDTSGKSWVELAADTDRLVGEGKREQAKRVVAEAWADMFPDSKIHANAIAQFLEFANWSCSDVLGAMVVTQENGIEASRVVGYVRKAVRNPVWKGKAKTSQQEVEDNPYSDPEVREATYNDIARKFGREAADDWIAGLAS